MTESTRRQLTFASGGWVLVASFLLILGLLTWALLGLVMGMRPVGDGVSAESYGFDLTTTTIPRETIVSSGNPRDFLLPLDDPEVVAAADVLLETRRIRGKHLVSSDRVAGVVVDGIARAYPLRMLNAHEIVNDTIGEFPVAVVYSPLCDAVTVFPRRIGDDVVRFRVSGLLHNANILMYTSAEEGDSLWSQLRGRAVAGPAAARGETLRALPCSVATWADWRIAHPDTTVLAAIPAMLNRYKQTDYERYFEAPHVDFPLAASPPADGPAGKTRVLVLESGGRRHVETYAGLAARAGDDGATPVTVGATTVRVTARSDGRTAIVDVEDEAIADDDILVYHAFWFAWHASHPEDRLAD